jgi:hypothetical protein
MLSVSPTGEKWTTGRMRDDRENCEGYDAVDYGDWPEEYRDD